MFDGTISSIEVSEVFGDTENLALGTTASHMLTVRTLSLGSADLTDATLLLKFGAGETQDTKQFMQYGKFYVTSVQSTDDYKSGTITAMDGFCKLQGAYIPSSSIGAGTTFAALTDDVLLGSGLSVDWNASDTYAKNKSTSAAIPSVVPTWFDAQLSAIRSGAYTKTQIIGFIAARFGCNALFNRAGNLVFRRFTDTTYKVDRAHIYQEGFNRTTPDTVVLQAVTFQIPAAMDSSGAAVADTDEEGTSTALPTAPDGWSSTSSGSEYTLGLGRRFILTSPFFFSTADAQEVYTSVLPSGSFTYQPGALKHRGNPCLEPGDVIKAMDRNGLDVTILLCGVAMYYDGGLYSVITSAGKSDAEDNYLDTGSASGSGGLSSPSTLAQQVRLSLTELSAVRATIQRLYVQDLTAVHANINVLTADVAEIKKLDVSELTADVAKVKELITDFATIDTAKVKLLTSDEIITGDITAVTASVTKYLTGVTIIGDVIKANTLTADKLLLKGEDGLYYAINAGTGALTAEQLTDEKYQNAIDGSSLVAKSVTADRIDVTDLFAQEVTATNLTISENSRLNGVSATGLIVSGDSVFSGKIVGKSVNISAIDPESGFTYGIKSSDGKIRINMLYGAEGAVAGAPTVGDKVTLYNSITGEYVTAIVTSVTLNSNGDSYSVEALENGYRTWWFSVDSSGNQFGGISYATQGGYYDETTGETTEGESGYIAGTVSAPNGWGSTGEVYIEVSKGTVNIVSDAVNIVATDITLTADSIKSNGDLTVAGKINGCTICDRETIGGTFVYGGSVVLDSTSNGQMWAASHPSFVGSIKDDGIWHNCLSIRHQNGSGDGNLYGMRILSPMTSAGSLIWQQQIGASAGWGTAKTILDTSNFGQKKTLSAVGASGWTNNATDDILIPSMSMIAYWNGAYTGTSSNLRYCANGEMIGTNNLSSKLPAAAPGTKGCAQMISGILTPGTVSAGSYLDYTYTFTSGTFTNTPTIVACTIESDAGTSASGNAARKVIVKSRSTTSVTFRLYNNSSSAWNPKIAYIGIYRG